MGGLTPFFQTLHNGDWDKVKAIRVLTYRNRKSIGKLDNLLMTREYRKGFEVTDEV